MGVPAWLVLRAGEQPGALTAAAAAALAWAGVRGARGRYAQRLPGESTGGPYGLLGDWLLLVGVLAVLRAVTGGGLDPATVVA
ncbi:MAG TPA: sugar transferase, partial [Streptomyces sp.]|nr:sugar transferase [Streptomyces sp.]